MMTWKVREAMDKEPRMSVVAMKSVVQLWRKIVGNPSLKYVILSFLC